MAASWPFAFIRAICFTRRPVCHRTRTSTTPLTSILLRATPLASSVATPRGCKWEAPWHARGGLSGGQFRERRPGSTPRTLTHRLLAELPRPAGLVSRDRLSISSRASATRAGSCRTTWAPGVPVRRLTPYHNGSVPTRRPAQYSLSAFGDASVAGAYRHRPLYPAVFSILLGLIADAPAVVLGAAPARARWPAGWRRWWTASTPSTSRPRCLRWVGVCRAATTPRCAVRCSTPVSPSSPPTADRPPVRTRRRSL